MFHFPKSKKLFESRESVGERGFFGFHLRMPRCYFFNLVETPMFVTTGYLSETFCENPKCGPIVRKMTMTKPDKNKNGLRQKPFLLAAISSICARVNAVHKLTRAARPFHLLTKSEKSKSQISGF